MLSESRYRKMAISKQRLLAFFVIPCYMVYLRKIACSNRAQKNVNFFFEMLLTNCQKVVFLQWQQSNGRPVHCGR